MQSTYITQHIHSTNAAVAAASPFFHKEQDEPGKLAREKFDNLIKQLNLDGTSTSTDTQDVVKVVAGDAPSLSFDQT